MVVSLVAMTLQMANYVGGNELVEDFPVRQSVSAQTFMVWTDDGQVVVLAAAEKFQLLASE